MTHSPRPPGPPGRRAASPAPPGPTPPAPALADAAAPPDAEAPNVDSAVTDPVCADLDDADPVDADLVDADLVDADLVDADPADAERLVEWVGGAVLADAGGAAWRDERFVAWLADEARAAERSERRASDASFLARGEALLARAQARRLGVLRYPAPFEAARAPRRVREGTAGAPPSRVVPVVELGVAAGPGRELWDEPPERWLRVPAALPAVRYLAVRVVGTSMAPMLASGDVVLVRADAEGREPRVGRVVVARHPDDGYVCKRVRAVGARGVVLGSLEPGNAPVRLPRDPALVLGTVVAAWPAR